MQLIHLGGDDADKITDFIKSGDAAFPLSLPRWTKQDWHDFFAQGSGQGLAFTLQNQLIGILAFTHIAPQAEIMLIAARPEYRRQGIARQLLTAMIDQLSPDLDSIVLEVAADNMAAICFYQKLKFDQIATRPNYYKATNSDALIFKRVFIK